MVFFRNRGSGGVHDTMRFPVAGSTGRLSRRLFAVETHAWTAFQEFDLPARETGIVYKPAAKGTPFPAPFEHGGIPIQLLIAHPTMFGLNAQQ